MHIPRNAHQVDKDAKSHGKIQGESSTQPLLLSIQWTLIALCQFTAHSLSRPFNSFCLGLEDENRQSFLFWMHLSERKLSILRKNRSIDPFGRISNVSSTSTCIQFHVTKLIWCDRICQWSITVINKEKSFTPNNSRISQYFCLKESSQRDSPEHVKISIMKKWHLFRWLIP